MDTFEIVMLGNTSVGKTSMLAALNEEIKAVNKVCGVQFRPCGDTTKELSDTWINLKSAIKTGGMFQPMVGKIEGGRDFRQYHFDLRFKGETRAKVDFIDTAGHFILNIEDSGLEERALAASGIFCVIDAAVLMQCDERTNNIYNRPDLIDDLLDRVFDREEHPKFVAFVLTKCETYMQRDEDIQRLRSRFHEVYAKSIDLVQKKRINSYAMAIQTLGCVQFESLVDVPWQEYVLRLPQYIRVPAKTKIEAHDCEAPLIVTMKNLLYIMRSRMNPIWKWILDTLGLGNGIDEYIGQLERIPLDKRVKGYFEELASDH